ncbi:hypothetical protein BH11GEM1_BH11GEM1_33790 [soil metagenome]
MGQAWTFANPRRVLLGGVDSLHRFLKQEAPEER